MIAATCFLKRGLHCVETGLLLQQFPPERPRELHAADLLRHLNCSRDTVLVSADQSKDEPTETDLRVLGAVKGKGVVPPRQARLQLRGAAADHGLARALDELVEQQQRLGGEPALDVLRRPVIATHERRAEKVHLLCKRRRDGGHVGHAAAVEPLVPVHGGQRRLPLKMLQEEVPEIGLGEAAAAEAPHVLLQVCLEPILAHKALQV
mmetsp:Transcript_105665/g.298635  ORF Transcript_105665/g.298635 Transcript_105665/m.298635 type:complete len:207 (-) Transcript_105665:1505-2125(-)